MVDVGFNSRLLKGFTPITSNTEKESIFLTVPTRAGPTFTMGNFSMGSHMS